MAKELLDGTNVVTVFEEVGRERVAKCMAGDPLGHAGTGGGAAHGALDDRLMKVMSPALPGIAVTIRPGGRKEPLPFE